MRWKPWQEAFIPPDKLEELRKLAPDDLPDKIYKNNLYEVWIRELPKSPIGPMIYLSIKRTDKKAPRDWRHFQRIKNELVGPESEAVELFPAESRLVDQANQFHLWCVPEGKCFPFGFFDGRVVCEDTSIMPGAVQRQFPDDDLPPEIRAEREAKNGPEDNEEAREVRVPGEDGHGESESI